MEARAEDVGGLVEQSRTKKWLPGCSHEKGDRMPTWGETGEVEYILIEELAEANLSEEEAGQQLRGEIAELESATEWSTTAIGNEEDVGDQVDLSISGDEA